MAGFVADASIAIAWVHPSQAIPQSQRLLQQVYDATYFELAQRKALPLACKDGPLRDAASRANIDVL